MPPSAIIQDGDSLLGDGAWRGVNMRLDPSILPPGFYSMGINVRCQDGEVNPRKGTAMLPWLNRIANTVITGTVTWINGIATFTTTAGAPHRRVTGESVTISGLGNSWLNGNFVVTVTSLSTFTYPAVSPTPYVSLTNLVGHWRLEEGAMLARVDAHTNGLDLVVDHAAPTAVVGKIGNANYFTAAAEQNLTRASEPLLQTGDIQFMLTGWVNPSSGALNDAVIVSRWALATGSLEFTVYFVAGKLRFYVSSNGIATTFVESAAALTAAYHFFVVWHDSVANTINIQIDNGAVVSSAYSGGLTAKSLRFCIGASQNNTTGTASYMDGAIDSVSYWKRILSAAERTIIYNAGTGLDYPFGQAVVDAGTAEIDGDGVAIQPWGAVYGRGVFRDPTTFTEYVLLAVDGGVVACLPNNAARQLPLPAGESVSAPCTFLQCFNVVLLLRGFEADPLFMDDINVGFKTLSQSSIDITREDSTATVTYSRPHGFLTGDTVRITGADQEDYNGSFEVTVIDEDIFTYEVSGAPATPATGTIRVNGNGTLEIPRALRGVFAANRAFLLREDDSLVASDVLDYTRYAEFNDFRVNQGADDKAVAISAFGAGTLVVLKAKSVFRIDNVYGDLLAATFSLVTQRYGCVAAETVVDCGSDLLWLSQEGVASLQLTIFNETQVAQGAQPGKPKMFSEDISPLLDRVHGAYAPIACAQLWRDRYYIALPIDQAELVDIDLVGEFAAYDNQATLTVPVIVGATYRFQQDSVDLATLTNGTEVLTASGDFVAQGTTVGLSNELSFTIATSSLNRIYKGQNTVLAVYSFQNAAWEGYDVIGPLETTFYSTGVGAFVTEPTLPSQGYRLLFTGTYVGKQRLFGITQDGYVLMLEEGFADKLPRPYAQVIVTEDVLPPGKTIQVNDGDLIATINAFDNSSGSWGVGGNSGVNLFADATSGTPTHGFGQLYTFTPWFAPNTFPVTLFLPDPVRSVIRFYATNGFVPSIVTNLTVAEGVTVQSVPEQEITMLWISRGYTPSGASRTRSQWLDLDLETWHPSYSVALLGDGVEETRELCADRTKSRTAYYRPFNAPAYVESNVNGDHATAHREDYAVIQSGPTWSWYLSPGVRTDLHQAIRETFRMNAAPDQATQVQVTTTQGRVRIKQLRLRAKGVGARPGSMN